jgi:hypothetical protein
MNYFGRSWGKPVDPRELHEKSWHRAKAIAWDDKWQALSVPARRAYLIDLKGPTKAGSMTNSSSLVDKIADPVVAELTKAGFVEVEAAKGKKAARIVPTQAPFDFSARLRAAHRYHVLGPTNRDELAKSIKHAFASQGETTLQKVLATAGLNYSTRLEEGLELYVTKRRWPEWALASCKSAAARPLLEALMKAKGPIPLHRLPVVVKGFNSKDLLGALTELIASLAVFEDVDPETFELIVGLLPEVRDDLAEAKKPRSRPLLVVCEHPKEVGPSGGLEINDLRVFLLEVASEAPRLRQDGGIFAKDEPRLREALPTRPGWIEDALKTSGERRLELTYSLARTLNLVEHETEDKTTWLRLSGKGRNWLAAGFEEQYANVYQHFRAVPKKNSTKYDDEYYDDFEADGFSYGYSSFGDSKFLGIPVTVEPIPTQGPAKRPYYYIEDMKPEQRDALRAALLEAFRSLPVGVFHVWESVLNHLCFGVDNPLSRGDDPAKLQISLDRRLIPGMPEHVEMAAKAVLELFLRVRLLPFDAVEAAIDAQGRLCIARLPRLDGFFGKPYQADPAVSREASRVIVQPDFSVLVIGLDPGPAAELAPFCDRAGGKAGQGALTFRITRDSVIRAARQGLSGPAIVARLQKHASVAVPDNVLREVRDWANWVRLVNVRPVTVVNCPDEPTAARVVSALGKKAEPLGKCMVAIQSSHLSTAERQKLQEHGILITKDDITVVKPAPAEPKAKPSPSLSEPKKRGRPKKVR